MYTNRRIHKGAEWDMRWMGNGLIALAGVISFGIFVICMMVM